MLLMLGAEEMGVVRIELEKQERSPPDRAGPILGSSGFGEGFFPRGNTVSYLYFVDVADGMVEFHGPSLLHVGLLSSAAVGRCCSAGCGSVRVSRYRHMSHSSSVWRHRHNALLGGTGTFVRGRLV